jgi:hypothetical protein
MSNQENLNQYEKIVVEVLSKMASGSGEARSEEQLFAEVFNSSGNMFPSQTEIGEAIFSLIQKGIVIHDEKIPTLICLDRQKLKKFLV